MSNYASRGRRILWEYNYRFVSAQVLCLKYLSTTAIKGHWSDWWCTKPCHDKISTCNNCIQPSFTLKLQDIKENHMNQGKAQTTCSQLFDKEIPGSHPSPATRRNLCKSLISLCMYKVTCPCPGTPPQHTHHNIANHSPWGNTTSGPSREAVSAGKQRAQKSNERRPPTPGEKSSSALLLSLLTAC